MKTTKMLLPGLIFLFCLLLIGCAGGPTTAVYTPTSDGNIAGVWLGLCHGIISPITFIISLFADNVNFYEVHNNGGW